MNRRLLIALFTVALLSQHLNDASAQFSVKVGAGITDLDEVGVVGQVSYTVFENLQSAALSRIDLGLSIDYHGEASDMPCPPGGAPPCPDGSEFLPAAVVSAVLFKAGPVSVGVLGGGGVAIGSAADPDVSTGTGIESRTAPALVYGGGLEVEATQTVSVFGQFRAKSIFTGEREFTNANGPFTVDVGTDSRWLIAGGIAIRF